MSKFGRSLVDENAKVKYCNQAKRLNVIELQLRPFFESDYWMSLGIAFKGPEGIVLAADSRVTLNAEIRQGNDRLVLPATFDNATKLLQVNGQTHVGVVTYGLGALGTQQPRTAHSFLPEFEDELGQNKGLRLGVEEFAAKLSEFFLRQWNNIMPSELVGDDMIFLVGGYDKGEAYGRLYQFTIPSMPKPVEQSVDEFGVIWGGQAELTHRLLNGFDPLLPRQIKENFALSDYSEEEIYHSLRKKLAVPIPYLFLTLQDCVDLSILLIRMTIEVQSFCLGVRGVGGAIDVATITRTDGFQAIRQKTILGERERI